MQPEAHRTSAATKFVWPFVAVTLWAIPSTGLSQGITYEAVRRAVIRYFRAIPDFHPTDLINRDQVEPLLGRLEKSGLILADKNKKDILARVPAKGEFLVDQLSTPEGQKFMRRIGSYPEAYDRLDRLSRLPHGRQTIRDLIKGPDGYKMIQYMTTTPGGKAMGAMLSQAPKGAHFNAPTGRIYTVGQLLQQIKKSAHLAG